MDQVNCVLDQSKVYTYLDDQLLLPTPSPNIETQQWLESQKGFLGLKIQQICTHKVGAAA